MGSFEMHECLVAQDEVEGLVRERQLVNRANEGRSLRDAHVDLSNHVTIDVNTYESNIWTLSSDRPEESPAATRDIENRQMPWTYRAKSVSDIGCDIGHGRPGPPIVTLAEELLGASRVINRPGHGPSRLASSLVASMVDIGHQDAWERRRSTVSSCSHSTALTARSQ